MTPLKYGLSPAERAKLLQAGVIAYREPVVLSEAKKARVERLRAYWKNIGRGSK